MARIDLKDLILVIQAERRLNEIEVPSVPGDDLINLYSEELAPGTDNLFRKIIEGVAHGYSFTFSLGRASLDTRLIPLFRSLEEIQSEKKLSVVRSTETIEVERRGYPPVTVNYHLKGKMHEDVAREICVRAFGSGTDPENGLGDFLESGGTLEVLIAHTFGKQVRKSDAERIAAQFKGKYRGRLVPLDIGIHKERISIEKKREKIVVPLHHYASLGSYPCDFKISKEHLESVTGTDRERVRELVRGGIDCSTPDVNEALLMAFLDTSNHFFRYIPEYLDCARKQDPVHPTYAAVQAMFDEKIKRLRHQARVIIEGLRDIKINVTDALKRLDDWDLSHYREGRYTKEEGGLQGLIGESFCLGLVYAVREHYPDVPIAIVEGEPYSKMRVRRRDVRLAFLKGGMNIELLCSKTDLRAEIDLLVEIDGIPVIIESKTGKNIHRKMNPDVQCTLVQRLYGIAPFHVLVRAGDEDTFTKLGENRYEISYPVRLDILQIKEEFRNGGLDALKSPPNDHGIEKRSTD